jgi:hypothetical protein
MDSYAIAIRCYPLPLTAWQSHSHRTARAAEPHGEEADEGIHECEHTKLLQSHATPLGMTAVLTSPALDVLQPRPAVFRRLRQQLREQVTHLAGRELRYAMRRQAHEGVTAVRRQVPGAECCDGTIWRPSGTIGSRLVLR